MNDFRPILFLRRVYKLAARVLATRLKGVIGKLVSDSQFAFIKGRNISEGWALALEVLDEMTIVGNGMIFKIDFKKAYDSID